MLMVFSSSSSSSSNSSSSSSSSSRSSSSNSSSGMSVRVCVHTFITLEPLLQRKLDSFCMTTLT